MGGLDLFFCDGELNAKIYAGQLQCSDLPFTVFITKFVPPKVVIIKKKKSNNQNSNVYYIPFKNKTRFISLLSPYKNWHVQD